jgi:substrate-binding family protein
VGVLAAADRCDIAVPGQLSVMGFDGIESAALLGLSTVRQPLETSGAEGARRLCALLREERVSPLRQQLALEVVHRSSTAIFRMTALPGPAAAQSSAVQRPDRVQCGKRRPSSFAVAGDKETFYVVRRGGAMTR